ncbi:MAG TPA: hypothetical protein VJ801_18225 [Polyangia bacterium]|jgi:hypothetical protein|nr:hypothetical protein [Polyangia bacterium]
MRKLGTSVMVCLFMAAMGCGSSDSKGGAGGSASGGTGTTATGGSGGTSTTAAGGSAGGGTGASSCSLPNCLKNLGTSCVESGSCATQMNLETGSWNTCYDIGIKEIVVNDPQTDDKTLAVKNGSSTCFSTAFNGNDVYVGMGSITVKDASGTAVASVRIDDADSLYKVTCTGSQEVVLDNSCRSAWPVSALMGSHCDEGGCTP